MTTAQSYSSTKPSLKVNTVSEDGTKRKRFAFENHALTLIEDEDIALMEHFLKTAPRASRQFIRKVDLDKAREIALKHAQKMGQQAHQGPMTAAKRAEQIHNVKAQMDREGAPLKADTKVLGEGLETKGGLSLTGAEANAGAGNKAQPGAEVKFGA